MYKPRKGIRQEIMKDRCVVCRKKTPYYYDTPIIQRRWYIEGSGQLCRECYIKVYKPTSGIV